MAIMRKCPQPHVCRVVHHRAGTVCKKKKERKKYVPLPELERIKFNPNASVVSAGGEYHFGILNTQKPVGWDAEGGATGYRALHTTPVGRYDSAATVSEYITKEIRTHMNKPTTLKVDYLHLEEEPRGFYLKYRKGENEILNSTLLKTNSGGDNPDCLKGIFAIYAPNSPRGEALVFIDENGLVHRKNELPAFMSKKSAGQVLSKMSHLQLLRFSHGGFHSENFPAKISWDGWDRCVTEWFYEGKRHCFEKKPNQGVYISGIGIPDSYIKELTEPLDVEILMKYASSTNDSALLRIFQDKSEVTGVADIFYAHRNFATHTLLKADLQKSGVELDKYFIYKLYTNPAGLHPQLVRMVEEHPLFEPAWKIAKNLTEQ